MRSLRFSADERNRLGAGEPARVARRSGRGPIVIAAAIAYSAMAATLEPFTQPIAVVTTLPFIALVALAWRQGWHRPGSRPPAGTLGLSWGWLTVWLVLFGVTAAFQLSMFFSAPRDTYPTFSSIAAVGFSWTPARAAAFAVWLAFGWYLVRR